MSNKIRMLVKALLLSMLAFTASAEEAKTMASLAPVLKNAMPAIVNVAVQGVIQINPAASDEEGGDEPQDRQLVPEKPRKFQSIGSGVVVDPKHGVIITNDHVIRNATLITVTLHSS